MFKEKAGCKWKDRQNLKPADFVELDLRYGILLFIENGYERFHLTGTQDVIDELDDYIRSQHEQRQK
ncbi:MAG: DUF3791 domain-containing protein [Oscillospiraceae bacterium]|nr:DUF3791 domain-containing protein [Oscillospiraceae bacterium]